MLRMLGVFVLAVTLVPNNANADPQRFTLSSPAFNDNAMLPLKYAGGVLQRQPRRQYLSTPGMVKPTCRNQKFRRLDDRS